MKAARTAVGSRRGAKSPPGRLPADAEAARGVSQIEPDDAKLRTFMADLFAAMSLLRLLRQEVASALSLSSAEYSVLLAVWYLERGKDMTLRAIADHLHVAAAYVTSEVNRLVDKGLLQKTPDLKDKRAIGVALSRSGRELLQSLAVMLRDVNHPLLTGVSYRDLDTVHRFLRGVIENGYDAIAAARSFHRGQVRPQRKRSSASRKI